MLIKLTYIVIDGGRMKTKYYYLTLYLFSFFSLPEDVTLYLNGEILAQSCNVSSDDLVKNINFPDLNSRDFSNIGDVSIDKMVSIHLKNCTGNVNNMMYQFSGEPDASDPTLLKVVGKANSNQNSIASGLAIEILDKNKNRILLNNKNSFSETISTTNYDFNFYLRYISTSKNINSGDASSLLYLDIYYE